MSAFKNIASSITEKFKKDDADSNVDADVVDTSAETISVDGKKVTNDKKKGGASSLLNKAGSALSSAGHAASEAASNAKESVTNFFSSDNDMEKQLWAALDQQERADLANSVQRNVADNLGVSVSELKQNAGIGGRVLIHMLSKAAGWQSGVIANYVDWMRAKNPDLSPRELQDKMADHFRLVASGTGGAAGLASAVPGIGFATGTAAIVAESILFLDLATFFTLAAAYMRGADLSTPERRQTFIMTTLLGAQGTTIVEAAVGDLAAGAGSRSTMSTVSNLSKMGTRQITEVNNRLFKSLGKTTMRKLLPASLGKLVPFGIGAVIGASASWKLSGKVVEHANKTLGALPNSFPTPAPKDVPETPKIVEELKLNREV